MTQETNNLTYPDYQSKPLRLSNEEINNPCNVFRNFFDLFDLREVKNDFKEWYTNVLRVDENVDAYKFFMLYDNIEPVLEAAFIINQTQQEALPSKREQAMELFIGILGHELEMHIDGVQTAINYFEEKKEKDAESLQYYLTLIKTITGDASNVLRNMITTAKHGSENLIFSVTDNTFYIDQWVRQVTTSFKMRASAQGRKLYINNLQNILGLRIATDKEKLGQILYNLFSNAFKFGPPGSTVSFDILFNDTDIIFRITNVGVISAEHIPSLFKPYVTIDAGYAGTGLGLYISKLYAELLGGNIYVNCTETHTVFTIEIPNCIQPTES